MMQRTLSDAWLRTQRPPAQGRLEISDARTPGLVIRITSGGAYSWCVRTRTHDGKQIRPKVGNYPAVGIAEARKRALAMLAAVQAGADPIADRTAARAARVERSSLPTVEQRLAEWQQKRVDSKAWSNRYAQEVRRLVAYDIISHPIAKRPLADTTRAEWMDLIGAIYKRSASVGSMAYRTISAFLAYAEVAGWIAQHPLPRKGHAVIAPNVAPRERTLTSDELRAIWGATDKLNPKPRAFARLLLLTGVREMEAADIATGELNLDGGRWAIPATRTKNGTGYTVPLPYLLANELRAVWPHHGERAGPAWKLLGGIAGSGLRGFSPIKRKLDALSGVAAWRWHDLRRTCRSGLSALGVPPDIAERAVNHISHASQLQRTYDRHGYAGEVIAALQRWQIHVLTLVGEEPADG